MSRNTKLTALALLSTTALSAVALPAFAQSNDEIIVTATRRATTVQDIPYNISAVAGKKIENMQIGDAAELLRSIPGIVVADRGPRNAATVNSIRIRGLNVDGAARGDVAGSSAATVATYINDTPLFTNMMLKDLERVEVLRGPQGTLYGSGALGGAVRYITKKPELGEFGGYAKGSVSTTDGSGGVSWTGDLVVNIPLGDKFAIRGVASHVDTAGIIDYVNVYELDANNAPVVPGLITDNDAVFRSVEDADTANIDFFRVTALIEPTDSMDLTLSYANQRDRIGGRRATAEGALDGFGNTYNEYTSGSVQLEPSETDLDMFSAEANIDLGFATLTSSTSYYDVNGFSISENTGFYAQKNWLANFYYNSPRPLARANRSYGTKAFVQEARLVSNNEGPMNWIAGVYYEDKEQSVGQVSTLAGYKNWAMGVFPWMSPGFGYDENDNDFLYSDVTDIKEVAVFGEVTYDVSEKLHVTLGSRWFDSTVGSNATVELPFWSTLFPTAQTVTESGKKDVLFKGNVAYDVGTNTMLYGTVSEGYRRGGASAVPLTGNFAEDPSWLSYGADTVVNYELGIKGATDALSYTAAVFYVDWTDPQINTSTTNWGFFTAANGDKAATKGIELEVSGRASDSLNYSLGYSYVDAELTADFLRPTGTVIATDGNTLPGVPSHTFNVAVDHTAELSNKVTLVTRVDGYAQSSSENYIDNSHPTFGDKHSGFSIWNASTTFEFDDFSVALFAKNLFNTEGVTATFSEAYMGTSPAQNYFGSGAKREITLPRTFGAALTYDF